MSSRKDLANAIRALEHGRGSTSKLRPPRRTYGYG